MRLLLVTDRHAARRPLAEAVRRALHGGVTAVMIREKDLSHDELVHLARDVVAACRDAGALTIVNHDVEAALRLGADGVHLGFRSVSVAEARAALGPSLLVGRSTHDLAELGAAHSEGADYVTFGPVRDTPSKRGLLAPCGLDGLATAVRAAGDLPVVGLGGLTRTDAAGVRATGAAGLAAVRALLDREDESAAARGLARAWDGYSAGDDDRRPAAAGA